MTRAHLLLTHLKFDIDVKDNLVFYDNEKFYFIGFLWPDKTPGFIEPNLLQSFTDKELYSFLINQYNPNIREKDLLQKYKDQNYISDSLGVKSARDVFNSVYELSIYSDNSESKINHDQFIQSCIDDDNVTVQINGSEFYIYTSDQSAAMNYLIGKDDTYRYLTKNGFYLKLDFKIKDGAFCICDRPFSTLTQLIESHKMSKLVVYQSRPDICKTISLAIALDNPKTITIATSIRQNHLIHLPWILDLINLKNPYINAELRHQDYSCVHIDFRILNKNVITSITQYSSNILTLYRSKTGAEEKSETDVVTVEKIVEDNISLFIQHAYRINENSIDIIIESLCRVFLSEYQFTFLTQTKDNAPVSNPN